jgi:uncharacterized membrane protein YuzA (DUF378 family)
MFRSPAMKIVGHVVWVVTAVAAINVGLEPFGFDLWTYVPATPDMLPMLVQYLIGACGVVSLVMFVMGCMGGSHACSCCK